MVIVALAGGSGGLGQEVLQAILVGKEHTPVVLSRKSCPEIAALGLKVSRVDSSNVEDLTAHLRHVDVVLSFIFDPEDTVQRNLIKACIRAGVKRFAPSEWAWTPGHMPTFQYKKSTRHFLQEINKPIQQLEYCFFQPGWFMNYLTYPDKSTSYFHQSCVCIDTGACKALVLKDHDPWICLTSVQDTAAVVLLALDYECPWPENGQIVGSRLKLSDIIKAVELARGQKFDLYEVDLNDLENGELKTAWSPTPSHPSMPKDESGLFARDMVRLWLLSALQGLLDGQPIWNERLPSFQATELQDFLAKHLR